MEEKIGGRVQCCLDLRVDNYFAFGRGNKLELWSDGHDSWYLEAEPKRRNP